MLTGGHVAAAQAASLLPAGGQERLRKALCDGFPSPDSPGLPHTCRDPLHCRRGQRAVNRVLGLILAGGKGERLSILAEERAKPAVIFGGKYRIIDFTLSNCVNSGINRVGVLTQYRPRSLNDHIGIGRPWDLDRASGGVVLLQPYVGRSAGDWYRGTADAVYQNLYFVEESRAEQVLVLSGDHIYNMRYDQMIDFHRQNKADATVAVVEVPIEEASRYGIVHADEDGRVIEFIEKPSRPPANTVSMGVYVFNRETLIERLTEDAHDELSGRDFGHNLLPAMVGKDEVYAYRFPGYWRDVGTIDVYWQAHMDLVADLPEFNLYDFDNPVVTRHQERPPSKLGPHAAISRSLISSGAIVNGTVQRSVLSPGVFVAEGATVADSILFDDVVIRQDCVINRCIIDKRVEVRPRSQLGFGDDLTANKDEPENLNSGITLVGKGACIPERIRVGRNCKVLPFVRPVDFENEYIESGSTISRKDTRIGV
ncbi:MAG: glucose-1-phosphate adenylyltransferase [Dehalococcoidia bacterium]|nr:glucose-1-phosphate adenylyltransferase [Dehalococcoidia bacterium]